MKRLPTLRVAVIGAGWAGCAAAVEATRAGHQVTLFEAARTAGGRARALALPQASGTELLLDNGQHILIGAYRSCLQLMRKLGVDTDAALLRLPLRLQSPDGQGLALPESALARRLPGALQAAWGIVAASGWTWADKLALMQRAARWQAMSFDCAPHLSVASLCHGLSPALMQSLIEPLCVSALNTPPERASAQVFLRVLKDALFAEAGGADLLLPRQDLGALLPDAALAWLAHNGARVCLGARVSGLTAAPQPGGRTRWQLDAALPGSSPAEQADDLVFDAVVLACPAPEAARLTTAIAPGWAATAQALTHEAIATVYACAPTGTRLAQPMLALPSGPQTPAQFVFDRGQLGGPAGLLAFVVSASQGDAQSLTAQVLAQAERQLGLEVQALQTVVEKRATFACTPGLVRPGAAVLPAAGLLACGDYVAGPYPATLEGAVRSGLAAAQLLGRFTPT